MPASNTRNGKETKENQFMARQKSAKISTLRVKSTWPSISDQGQQDMVQLLRDVSLPVLHAIRGDKKRQEFQQLLYRIEQKAQRKLARLPVPPSTRNTHYKYDRLAAQRDRLQHALHWSLEHITQLEREIDNQQQQLDDDKEYLEQLKHNAQSQKHISTSQPVKIALDLLSKYDADGSDATSINYTPHASTYTQPESLTTHIDKLTQNTDQLTRLLNSVEALSNKVRQ